MYSLHDIEVNGLDLAEVLECEIESRAGEHSTLVILARVTEEEFVFEISDCQDLEVLLREGEGRKILFSGILTDIQITESGQVKTVRIEGKSRSWLMDREKHSRSFQNAKMTFQELAQEILANYKDADLISASEAPLSPRSTASCRCFSTPSRNSPVWIMVFHVASLM